MAGMTTSAARLKTTHSFLLIDRLSDLTAANVDTDNAAGHIAAASAVAVFTNQFNEGSGS